MQERKTIYLNPTQAVVISLVNLLPGSTYHAFLDNLFFSNDLFRRLRQLGHGATGTARRNCGIYTSLVKLKAVGNTAAGSLAFNALKAVPAVDNKVSQEDTVVLYFLTIFSSATSIRSHGKTMLSCYSHQLCLQALKEVTVTGKGR